MKRKYIVQLVALIWGLAVFFPLGFSYLGLILLIFTIALDSNAWGDRWKRLRKTPYWIPSLIFVLWVGVVLVINNYYPETASNIFHIARILLTLWLVLSLSQSEIVFAIRGFLIGLSLAVFIVLLDLVFKFPVFSLWGDIISYRGNKSIANAFLFLLAIFLLIFLLPYLSVWWRVMTVIFAVIMLGIMIFVLPSRASWVSVVVCVAVVFFHTMRTINLRRLVILLSLSSLFVLGIYQVPQVSNKMHLGFEEVASAQKEKPSAPHAGSWGIRYRIYSETFGMVLDRPILGWGIGAWNQKWRERAEPEIAVYNATHNDFLWVGAQTGFIGFALFFWLMIAGLPAAWRLKNTQGKLGVVSIFSVLVLISFNSGLRDAAMGATFWFVALLFQRIAVNPDLKVEDVILFGKYKSGLNS